MMSDGPRCSVPNCRKSATHQVVAPWSDGVVADFRGYGYSCPGHAGAVIASAQLRLRRSSLLPGESIGEIAVYLREDAPVVLLQPH
jgi:hypothetical protein